MRSAQVANKILGVLFATAVLAGAQSVPEQPDALDVLKNVALTYSAMRTFSAKSTTMMEMDNPNMQQKIETPMTITADSSGKMRMETTSMGSTLTIFDGSTLWMYITPLNKYMKIPWSSAASSGQPRGGDLGAPAVSAMQMSNPATNSFFEYRSVASHVKEAKILRSEKLHANGSDVDCWVVSVEYESAGGEMSAEQAASAPAVDLVHATTLWVDKTHYLVYRDDSTGKITIPGTGAPTETRQTINFDSITVDQPIPEGTFTFTPPPGATEMDLSSFIPKTLPTK
jgi:outer membrane lipoprotein-sorting protein